MRLVDADELCEGRVENDPDSKDDESGIPHYKHMACNMAFICDMMKHKD